MMYRLAVKKFNTWA